MPVTKSGITRPFERGYTLEPRHDGLDDLYALMGAARQRLIVSSPWFSDLNVGAAFIHSLVHPMRKLFLLAPPEIAGWARDPDLDCWFPRYGRITKATRDLMDYFWDCWHDARLLYDNVVDFEADWSPLCLGADAEWLAAGAFGKVWGIWPIDADSMDYSKQDWLAKRPKSLWHPKFVVADDFVWEGSMNFTGQSHNNFEIASIKLDKVRADNLEQFAQRASMFAEEWSQILSEPPEPYASPTGGYRPASDLEWGDDFWRQGDQDLELGQNLGQNRQFAVSEKEYQAIEKRVANGDTSWVKIIEPRQRTGC